MISLQIEVTAYDDDIEEWCLENGYDYQTDLIEDYIYDLVDDWFGISADSIRVL